MLGHPEDTLLFMNLDLKLTEEVYLNKKSFT